MRKAWEKRRIKYPTTKETRKKLNDAKRGKPGHKPSEETKRKQSESHKGKKHKRVICQYCGKNCTPSTLVRWHNDNCKFKV